MITQLNHEKQLVELVLRTTMSTKLSSSKSSKKTSQKYIDLAVQKIMAKFNTKASELNYNKNEVSQYCISQLQKRKSPKIGEDHPGLYAIQTLDITKEKQQQKDFFQKKKSKRIDLVEYTYLKVERNLYMFNHAFIPTQKMNITFVLSSSRIQSIFSYVQLCLHLNSLIRCIMPIGIWQRVNAIYELFWGNSVFQLLSNSNLVLFPQQKTGSFDFQNSMLIFNKKLWLWDSYDLYLVIKGSKFLIKSPGIEENQAIYSAWRSNIIDQPQYCRLIDKTLKTNVVWGSSISDRQYFIKQEYRHFITSGVKNYLSFYNSQIFLPLPQEIIKEIYHSGQITEYHKNQVVYKSQSPLDKFFIVIQGQVVLEKDNSKTEQILKASDYYNLLSILEQVPKLNTTLKVSSQKCLIFSIPIWRLRYFLGHFVEQISMIVNYQSRFQLPEDLKLSKWTQNIIKIDENKSTNLSQNSTKKIGGQKIKISKQLWRKLCIKDLKFLFITLQQEDEILQ